MKKPYKHWTKEDDTCLLNHIKNNSDNLRKAFRLASRDLSRDVRAVSVHWYSKLKKTVDIFNIHNKTKNFKVNTKNNYQSKVTKNQYIPKKSTSTTIKVTNGTIKVGSLIINGDFELGV